MAAALAALYELASPTRPNVLILTVESARADAVSPAITPNLWRASETALAFAKHRAVSAWTAPNIIAILAGLSPFEQGVHTRSNSVAQDWVLPLEDLRRRSWRIAGLQAFAHVEVYRFLGLDIEAGADPLAWMAKRARRREPFVLWYHYLDTHLPYAPSAAFRPDWRTMLPPGDSQAIERIETVTTRPAILAGSVRFRPEDRPAIRALYEGGFREFDSWFGRLWEFLQGSGLIENTVVVLTTDHGEELLERGEVGHASTTRAGHLHEEIVRVPLRLWIPPGLGRPGAADVETPSDHLDIMPTIMALLGETPTRRLLGQNLIAKRDARPWTAISSRAGFAEPDAFEARRFVAARIEPPWKLQLSIENGAVTDRRLYDLEHDPEERRDLAPTHEDVASRLADRLWAATLAMRPPSRPPHPPGVPRERPRWIFPVAGGTVSYDQLGGRFHLEWTGATDGDYVIEYVAGEGSLAIAGTLEAIGTRKEFGVVGRRYWNTWIVPYRNFRVRVGVSGRDDLWSEWLDLVAVP